MRTSCRFGQVYLLTRELRRVTLSSHLQPIDLLMIQGNELSKWSREDVVPLELMDYALMVHPPLCRLIAKEAPRLDRGQP